MAFRNSASFGKRQEYIAIAELLRKHFDVYLTLVDDQQIDCVLRQEKEGKLRYLDIQIKARSNECKPDYAGTFAAMEIRNPRENFFFIFYSEQVNMYWVMPSLQLIKEAHQNKEGENKGKYSINFCNVTARGVVPRPRFTLYESAFNLLEWDPREGLKIKPMKAKDTSYNLRPIEPPKASPTGHQMPPSWEEINKLKSRTLDTLKDKRKFSILDISNKKVYIRIESTGKERSIDIEKELIPACQELRKRSRLTRKEIEIYFAPRNPAYVAAIMAEFIGVKHVIKPVITLFFD